MEFFTLTHIILILVGFLISAGIASCFGKSETAAPAEDELLSAMYAYKAGRTITRAQADALGLAYTNATIAYIAR